jgi:hypothetical protein
VAAYIRSLLVYVCCTDDGVTVNAETCRSCFNVNFNVNFNTVFFKTTH